MTRKFVKHSIFFKPMAVSFQCMTKSTTIKKKKKDVQLEICELSFIGGKMRTVAREAASQIALRDCSKAAVGESQYIRFW